MGPRVRARSSQTDSSQAILLRGPWWSSDRRLVQVPLAVGIRISRPRVASSARSIDHPRHRVEEDRTFVVVLQDIVGLDQLRAVQILYRDKQPLGERAPGNQVSWTVLLESPGGGLGANQSADGLDAGGNGDLWSQAE